MEQIKSLLEERKMYLLKLKSEKEKSLKRAPAGSLRVCKGRKKAQYYRRTDPKDPNGVYIQDKNVKLAQKLAQKDYDQKVIYNIERELKVIEKYLSSYPEVEPEKIYENLHKERQKLVAPIKETDEQFVLAWENVEYQGKEIDESVPELYTSKGHRVRSKSELIIADALAHADIPYRYECPIYLKGLGKVYPDFTALNVRLRKKIYWEHFGMMDDPAYAEKAIQKIALYEQNGIFPGENLIITYETKKNPINQKMVTLMIKQYLK